MHRTDNSDRHNGKFTALGNIYVHRAVKEAAARNRIYFVSLLVVLVLTFGLCHQCNPKLPGGAAEVADPSDNGRSESEPLLTWAEAFRLVEQHANRHLQRIEERVGKAFIRQGGQSSSLTEICQLNRPYQALHAPYRNEFSFTTDQEVLHYRNKLIEAGIADENLDEPCIGKAFESFKALLLSIDDPAPDTFRMAYALVNQRPLQMECVLKRVEPHHYRAKVTYQQPIRAMMVNAQFTSESGRQKQRSVHFYGFLPEEPYDIVYRDQRWILQSQSSQR